MGRSNARTASPARPRPRGPTGRVNPLEALTVGLGVSGIPARFRGRVLLWRESVQPEADERKLAAIVSLRPKVCAELVGYGRGGTLDALETTSIASRWVLSS